MRHALYARVTEMVACSACKVLQMCRPIQLERSAAASWALKAETPSTSARGHRSELNAQL